MRLHVGKRVADCPCSIVVQGMRGAIALVLYLPIALVAAAPDSIAGKVYRESFAVTSIRTAKEKTILFEAGGRFKFLKSASVSFVAAQFEGRVVLDAPQLDGAYTYRKTGDSTGVFELRFDDGATETTPLNFTSMWTGTNVLVAPGSFPDFAFAFGDLEATRTAPATNLSMRGRVEAGRPLMVGFVVPGTREPGSGIRVESPDATGRDVLIRVVGPSLSRFGITSTWVDPDFRLYDGANLAAVRQFQYADWSSVPNATGALTPSPASAAGFRKIFDYVGAFPLVEGSKDAAAVVRLSPGAYTIVANPAAGDAGGEVLIEVYFLP